MWLGGLPLLTDEPGVRRGPVLTATLLGIIMDETLDASLDRIAAVQAAGSVALEGHVYLACGVQ